MKILHINTSDLNGGAARAAYRLHKSLLFEGVESKILVQQKLSDDYTVDAYPKSFSQKILSKLRPIIDSFPVRFYNTKTLFSTSWFGFNNVVNQINALEPDVVHLHWINMGMIKLEHLTKIKAPIVWTLHDNWPFTGGCHIMWDCIKYKDNCGACPRLDSRKKNDLSRKIFNRKKYIFSKLPNMVIIGVSNWIKNCAKESSLFKNHQIIKLPNPIDTSVFKPSDKKLARELWNLPSDKKLVLFGAMRATDDINKGFKELSESLNLLNETDNIEFVIFGSSEPRIKEVFKFKTHYLGHLNDNISLVTLYSAVDVMIVPSLQESFGQTASESMACGTPVVAFAHSGLLDIIDHKITGYLAKPFETKDLARGIEWILNHNNFDEISKAARKKIIYEFDSRIVVQKYIELYDSILNDSKVRLK